MKKLLALLVFVALPLAAQAPTITCTTGRPVVCTARISVPTDTVRRTDTLRIVRVDTVFVTRPDTLPTPPPVVITGDSIFADGFEGTLAYDDKSGAARIASGAAHSGTKFLQVPYPAGASGGWLIKFFPNQDSIYASVWVRFPTTWRGHTKLLAVYGGKVNDAWSPYGTSGVCPNGTDFFSTMLVTEPSTGNPGTWKMYTYWPGMPKEPDNQTCWGRYGTWAGTTIPLGSWQQLGLWVKLNTPGEANGEQVAYVNGREVGRWTNMIFRTASVLALNSVQLTFDVSSGGSTVAQTLDLDDLQVSRKRPTGSTPPPPLPVDSTPQLPPPPVLSGSYPNQPAGAIALVDWDTDFSNLPTTIWGYISGASNLSTVTDPTAPVNPAKVGRVRFNPGCCDGTGPARLETYKVPPSGWTQWYVSDWVKFDPAFKPHPGWQKIFEFFWASGGDKWLIVKADNENGGAFPLIPRFTTEYAGSPPLNLGSQAVLKPGLWYQYEAIVHKSGRIQLWTREQGKSPQVMYDGTPPGAGSISPGFLFWWWGYGGRGAYSGTVPAYIYHNHFRVSWK